MKLFGKKEKVNLLKQVYSEKRLFRYTEFIIGIFLISVAYNIFIQASDTMYGVGGIGIVLKKLYNIPNYITILISDLILLVFSYLLLGREKTAHSVLGSILYPVFVKLTEWLIPYVDLGSTETIVIVVLGATITGIGLGLVFRAAFTTGGTDILNQILSKYGKMSIGKAMIITDGLVIVICSFVFGFQVLFYSIISLYLISIISDKVIIGVSQSKAFYIITDNETKVKKFLIQNLSHGVTVLNGRGGYTGDNQKVLMCIIPTREYYLVKEGIMDLDPNAFFLVTDAYEVSGGA